MVIQVRKGLRPQTARILTGLFLVCGILLGAFIAPHYLEKIGLGIASQKIAEWAPFRFGLDIQGGTHLVYQADLSHIPAADQKSSMDAVRDIIERRIQAVRFGVEEPVIQVEKAGSEWRLIVELPGIKDINAAIRLIGQTPFVEFKEERDAVDREAIQKDQTANGPRAGEDPFFKSTKLTGRFITQAALNFDQTTSRPYVVLEFNSEGTTLFAELTKKNIGKSLAIYLDGQPIEVATVQEEIADGKAQISGGFTPDTARALVERLKAGALPVPISLVAQQSIGASLGEESFARSVSAGVIGFIAVALFMIFWYRLPGLLAVFALLLYIAIVLSFFKLIPVTLSVAGIAGFILSIGMAVDANVLIFERLKEELRQGKGMDEAVREGFARAWTSIRDSNISSLITSAILYWMGTSIVQGFALTLSIGILVSMFSAISVTRTLLFAVMTPRLQSLRGLFMSGFTK